MSRSHFRTEQLGCKLPDDAPVSRRTRPLHTYWHPATDTILDPYIKGAHVAVNDLFVGPLPLRSGERAAQRWMINTCLTGELFEWLRVLSSRRLWLSEGAYRRVRTDEKNGRLLDVTNPGFRKMVFLLPACRQTLLVFDKRPLSAHDAGACMVFPLKARLHDRAAGDIPRKLEGRGRNRRITAHASDTTPCNEPALSRLRSLATSRESETAPGLNGVGGENLAAPKERVVFDLVARDGCARSAYELRTIRQSSPGRLIWFSRKSRGDEYESTPIDT